VWAQLLFYLRWRVVAAEVVDRFFRPEHTIFKSVMFRCCASEAVERYAVVEIGHRGGQGTGGVIFVGSSMSKQAPEEREQCRTRSCLPCRAACGSGYTGVPGQSATANSVLVVDGRLQNASIVTLVRTTS
jgi:hypothetical protein